MSEPTTPIPDDEFAWAQECLLAGDTLEEVADWSGRPIAQWRHRMGRLAKLPKGAQAALSWISAGCSQEEAAALIGTSRKVIAMQLFRLRHDFGLAVPFGRQSRGADRAGSHA